MKLKFIKLGLCAALAVGLVSTASAAIITPGNTNAMLGNCSHVNLQDLEWLILAQFAIYCCANALTHHYEIFYRPGDSSF